MRPVRPNCIWAGSSNFLHSSFAKLEVFLFSKIFRLRAGLSTKNRSVNFSHGTKLKDLFMKKLCLLLALASLFLVPKSPAISLDDIQLWTGSGTNRAALVVEWN